MSALHLLRSSSTLSFPSSSNNFVDGRKGRGGKEDEEGKKFSLGKLFFRFILLVSEEDGSSSSLRSPVLLLSAGKWS